MQELAKRAVACKGWRWMPGMRVAHDGQTAILPDNFMTLPDAAEALAQSLPDLTDPATIGCLLALVRDAWGDKCAYLMPIDFGTDGIRWLVQLKPGGRGLTYRTWPTEAEVLVAALEAAP